MEVEKIKTEKDEREENLIKNEEGKVVGYKQSEYTVRIYFDNGRYWVANFKEIAEAINQIAENEDYKYPKGMGRNMMFLKHLYPIFKDYLERHGFKPSQRDLEFAQKGGKL